LQADPVIANPKSFWLEAQSQRVCAVCHGVGVFDAHHVVDKQTLKRQGLTRNELYDTRNAMRLCSRFGNNCHFQHENRRRVVKTGELLDVHIEYAWEVLGPYAIDFLRREYDDYAQDPRIRELESRCEQ
jgi:hypothetical protein